MQGRTWIVLACALLLAGCGSSDSLLTIDRVGRADAPKTLTLQINASYSPQASTPSVAAGFKKLFTAWARKHPDGARPQHHRRQHDHDRAGAPAREGQGRARAPDCANVDSFTIPLFIEQGVLQPLDKYFSKAAARRPVPVRAQGDDRAGRAHLRLVVVDRPARALPPHRPRAEGAADLGRADRSRQDGAEEGPEGRRLPVQRRPLGGDDVRQPRVLLDAGRQAARRRGKPMFARARTRAKMLNVFKLLRKRTSTAGVTPSRVTTFNTYDEFVTAAQARHRRDVPRRLVPVADDAGGARQGLRQVEGLRAARARSRARRPPAPAAGRWRAFSKDPEKVAACASTS